MQYTFGEISSSKTFDYLANNISTWELAKIEIPGYSYSPFDIRKDSRDFKFANLLSKLEN